MPGKPLTPFAEVIDLRGTEENRAPVLERAISAKRLSAERDFPLFRPLGRAHFYVRSPKAPRRAANARMGKRAAARTCSRRLFFLACLPTLPPALLPFRQRATKPVAECRTPRLALRSRSSFSLFVLARRLGNNFIARGEKGRSVAALTANACHRLENTRTHRHSLPSSSYLPLAAP
jgi:hypothetical protein